MLWHRLEHKCSARKSFEQAEQREAEAVLNIKLAKVCCHICTSRTYTENCVFRRVLDSLGSVSETLKQRFSLITGHAHREVPSTQMDVKLLSALGTGAGRAGIRPHARIYNFFNQADTLENIQARQTQQIN